MTTKAAAKYNVFLSQKTWGGEGGIKYTMIKKKTYILRKSMTSGDKGEAPDAIKRTRPPSFSLILLNTNLSQIGDALFPEM